MYRNAHLNFFTQTPLSLVYTGKKSDISKSFNLACGKLRIKKTGDCLINVWKCCSFSAWISLLLLGVFVNSNYNRSRLEILLFHNICKGMDFKTKKSQPNKSHASAVVSRKFPCQKRSRSSPVLIPDPPSFLPKWLLVCRAALHQKLTPVL